MAGPSSEAGGDRGLMERLEWVQGWVRGAADSDADETCRMMAEACVNIQAGAANAALQSLKIDQASKMMQPSLKGSGGLTGHIGLLMPGEAGWIGSSRVVVGGEGPLLSEHAVMRSIKQAPLMVEVASLNHN